MRLVDCSRAAAVLRPEGGIVARTPEQTREDDAHQNLRAAIHSSALAQWDRRMTEDPDDAAILADSRTEVERGLLVDYVVVAVFDNGDEDATTMAVIRTDGKCAHHRTVGLLHTALTDTLHHGPMP